MYEMRRYSGARHAAIQYRRMLGPSVWLFRRISKISICYLSLFLFLYPVKRERGTRDRKRARAWLILEQASFLKQEIFIYDFIIIIYPIYLTHLNKNIQTYISVELDKIN
jgi:hypothetical protein